MPPRRRRNLRKAATIRRDLRPQSTVIKNRSGGDAGGSSGRANSANTTKAVNSNSEKNGNGWVASYEYFSVGLLNFLSHAQGLFAQFTDEKQHCKPKTRYVLSYPRSRQNYSRHI